MIKIEINLRSSQYNNLLIEGRKRSKTISALIREAVDKSFGAKKDVGLDRPQIISLGYGEKGKIL